MIPTIEDIAWLAAERAYGTQIVTNYHRSDIVEAIVSYALPNGPGDWEWCAGDWAGYDFRHPGVGEHEIRLEVKQTSALQSWGSKSPSKPEWDIAPRKGRWEGSVWIARAGRNADIYVLGKHAVTDRVIADHRDPAQWRFYVVSAACLPELQKKISESALLKRKLAEPVDFLGLGREVENLRSKIADRLTAELREQSPEPTPA